MRLDLQMLKQPTRWLMAALLMGFALSAHAEPPAAPEPAAPVSPSLDLFEFKVVGNTVLPQIAIEDAVYPLLGPGKTFDDVEKARAALEQAYHDAGYLTVSVSLPEQKVVGGVVTLKVSEGVIERTRVTGAQYTLPSRIRAEIPSGAEGQVPNFPEMQHELQAANRAPGVRVTPTLEAGRVPGTTVLELKVNDTPPLAAWLDFNNAYSANTAHTRLAGGVSYSNLFQLGHTISLTYQTAPTHPEEASAVSASYMVPLAAYQRFLSFYGVHSSSDVATAAVNVGNQALFGNNDILGALYIMPLRARPDMTHQAMLGLSYNNSKQDANGFNTPVTYWKLGADYGMGLNDANGSWQLGASAVLGIRGPGTGDVSFGERRYLAHNSFAVLKLNAQRLQNLPAGWSLLGSTNMQLADQALINNEQFTAGGVGSVRGYLQAEAAGDKGIQASLELRAPVWAPESLPWLKSVQPYAFFDAAYLRVNDPLPEEIASYTLDSVGLGLEVRAGRGFLLTVSVAEALTDGPNNDLSVSPPQPFTLAHDIRVQFDTRVDF